MFSGDRKLSHSQNFFRRAMDVERLLNRSNIGKEDLVVEIGPGRGMITESLTKRAGRVLAVEIDSALVDRLRAKFHDQKNIEIVQADFLRWPLPGIPYKVFANIPFNMTADILKRLFFTGHPPLAVHVIMQRQAALKYVGRPFWTETLVSLLIKPWYETIILASIPRYAFVPVPNVDIVLASFVRRVQPLVSIQDAQQYRDFIVYAFGQRKASLSESFAKLFTQMQLRRIDRRLKIFGLTPTQASFETWLKLFADFMILVSEEKKHLVVGAEAALKKDQSRLEKQYRTRYSKRMTPLPSPATISSCPSLPRR